MIFRFSFLCAFFIFFTLPCGAQTEKTKFSNNFSFATQYSFKSNVLFLSNTARVSNTAANSKARLVTPLITRETNEKWANLTINYALPGNLSKGSLTINILDNNNNNKFSISTSVLGGTAAYSIAGVTNKSIKLEAVFARGGVPPWDTPLLYLWKTTAILTANYKSLHGFIGAPSPLILSSEDNTMRFYYNFKKNCKVTLKIYDPNYNLVKTLKSKESYRAETNLDAEWDGKNGNNITVMSGVYIAIISIENDDGTKDKPLPFNFAVIR